jgi:hypothetical protein
MKSNHTLKFAGLAVLAVVAVTAVAFGAFKVADGLSDSGKVSDKCGSGKHTEYDLVITNDVIAPNRVKAKLCDTMKITNKDDRSRLMAFGKHDHHEPYDGITERYLLKDESFTVTLNKAGNFLVHDHHEDEVAAIFDVSK